MDSVVDRDSIITTMEAIVGDLDTDQLERLEAVIAEEKAMRDPEVRDLYGHLVIPTALLSDYPPCDSAEEAWATIVDGYIIDKNVRERLYKLEPRTREAVMARSQARNAEIEEEFYRGYREEER